MLKLVYIKSELLRQVKLAKYLELILLRDLNKS